MRETQAALAFSQRLDSILTATRNPVQDLAETLVSEGDLETARTLAALDFSRASRVRDTLKRSATAARPTPVTRSLLRMARRPVVKAIGLAALLLGLLQCAWPGGIRGLVISIGDVISGKLSLGSNTTYEVVDHSVIRPAVPTDVEIQMGWSRIPRTGLPKDINPSIVQFDSFSEAVKLVVDYTPRLPRWFPRGWKVRLVLVLPSKRGIVTFFMKEWRTLEYWQSLDGGGWGANKASGITSRTIMFDGVEAVWQSVQISPKEVETTLVWEREGISYAIAAETLTLEEVVRIAASIR